MSDKEKLESLYASLPGELRSPSAILLVIEILIAVKKLYDLLHKDKAKLFTAPPTTDLCWTVINGDENGKGVD